MSRNTIAHLRDQADENFGQHNYKIRGTRHPECQELPFEPDIYPTCSYCGSLTPEDAIAAMQIAGTRYSGSDWKYGWPHKFYFDIPCEPYRSVTGSHTTNGNTVWQISERTRRHKKFYSLHMKDASPEVVAQWNKIVVPQLGVAFLVEGAEKKLRYIAVCGGWQTWGMVGKEKPPQFDPEKAMDLGPAVPQGFLDSIAKEV